MTEAQPDPLAVCAVHEMQNCALCNPPKTTYRRGLRFLEVPAGSYIMVKGGKGVYHYPDCYNVTGDWDGAEQAVLGDPIVLMMADLLSRDLRPAQCCYPPAFAGTEGRAADLGAWRRPHPGGGT